MYMKSFYKVEKHLYFIWQIACLRKIEHGKHQCFLLLLSLHFPQHNVTNVRDGRR